MIISASRRTDIPAYYSQWMVNRIKEKYVCVRNPMNIHQVSKVNISADVVDCIVFWSKNPKPLMEKLNCFNDYTYYFQFSLNPYDRDIETNLPNKNEILDTFKKLSDKITPEKVVWRYDPVLINNKYTIQYHIDKFNFYANELKGYTEKVIFSYIDFYKKITENVRTLEIKDITDNEKHIIAENFSKAAKENNLSIDTCAEDIDLSKYDIGHARCIDDRLISKLTGYAFKAEKDKNQRLECGCISSIDIGEYNSCLTGCLYCYANCNKKITETNVKKHLSDSPLLIGKIQGNDNVSDRKILGDKTLQMKMF